VANNLYYFWVREDLLTAYDHLLVMIIYTEEKAERFLSRYVPVARNALAKKQAQAVATAKKLGFPLVLKLISPKALHKTEVKGVRIVNNSEELKKEYDDLCKTAKKKKLPLAGILVQEFVKGEEVLIGIKYDNTFGHVIAFGVGGKYTELLKDVSFRICPITEEDAQSMIDGLRMRQLLYGVRGSKPVNIKLLKQVMVKVSKIPLKNKKIMELDINPFIINDKTGKVVDARIVMK
jgi:succinyl-CoA synthetase beta subunit